MNRRDFSKSALVGLGTMALPGSGFTKSSSSSKYIESAKEVPVRHADVVVAGGGSAGVIAAIAAARTGAKTMLIERKGYTGGTVVEGGTAIHSYYNIWKAFPGVEKRQVVQGIATEIIDELMKIGGTTGYPEMEEGSDYDSVCTAIDTELFKLVSMKMLAGAGVHLALNTWVADAIVDNGRLVGVLTESHAGREAVMARSFVDCTAYGDLAVRAGAKYTVPNDYAVCNSMGVANISIDEYYKFLKEHDAVSQYCEGQRSGKDGEIIRLSGKEVNLPFEFEKRRKEIGMSTTTTTVHDNYFMFIKCDYYMKELPTDPAAVSRVEVQIRQNQYDALQLFKDFIPGCEKAFIARTSPSLNTRRARFIECEYDITLDDIVNARHFNDDVGVYGYHSKAPRIQIKIGGTYGIPYRALIVKGLENLFVAGQMITSDQQAHFSTFSISCCQVQGQAAGTAAALCSQKNVGSRDLKYGLLRDTLEKDGVYFES